MSRISDIHQNLNSKNLATVLLKVVTSWYLTLSNLIKLTPRVIMSHFAWWLSSKESTCHAGDLGSIPVRKIPWRTWQPTPVFLPEKSMDRAALWATVHEVTRVRHKVATEKEWWYEPERPGRGFLSSKTYQL